MMCFGLPSLETYSSLCPSSSSFLSCSFAWFLPVATPYPAAKRLAGTSLDMGWVLVERTLWGWRGRRYRAALRYGTQRAGPLATLAGPLGLAHPRELPPSLPGLCLPGGLMVVGHGETFGSGARFDFLSTPPGRLAITAIVWGRTCFLTPCTPMR